MTNVDLHPDELLEPSRLRTLSPSERERLDRHLAVCRACAFEIAATEGFCRVLDARSPAEDAAVARIVERTWSKLGAAGGMPIVRKTALPRARLGRRILLVAAILAVAAGAAAWYFAIAPLVREAPRVETTPALQADAGRSAPAPAVPQTPPVVTPRRTMPPRTQPTAPPAPPVVAPTPPAPPPARPQPDRPPAHAPTVSPEPPEPPVPMPVDAATAASLFSDANDLRRAGSYADAVELYRKLQERFPMAGEASVSYVTLGRLLLDRMGDPAGALEQFDAYATARPNGTLVEDALAGRALALQRLGRDQEERAAWTELLVRFPGTAYAARAHERLAPTESSTTP